MTSIEPALPEIQRPHHVFDYDKWQEDARLRREAIADKVAIAKTTLFDIFHSHGIAFVIVAFDGYGDSGQIDGIVAHDDTGIVGLPDARLPAINIESIEPASSDPDAQDMAITDVIENLAYDLLEESNYGWEDNEGAFGEFRFDTADRTITLGYNQRHMSSKYSQDTW